MNLTPAPAQTIALDLLQAPAWISDPALTGVAGTGATFRLVRPYTLGLGVMVRYRLTKVDADGGAEQPLGEVSRLLGLCTGQDIIQFPVAVPVTLDHERLRLTISSTASLNLSLRPGEGTFLEAANFVGVP
jgi:hypothetical protein